MKKKMESVSEGTYEVAQKYIIKNSKNKYKKFTGTPAKMARDLMISPRTVTRLINNFKLDKFLYTKGSTRSTVYYRY